MRRFWLLCAFEGSLFAFAEGLGRLTGFSPLAGLSSTPAGFAAAFGATAALFLLFAIAYENPRGPLRSLFELLRSRALPLFAGFGVIQLGCLAFFAGLGEEALFRGWLQRWAESRLGAGFGLAVSAALFGLAHAVTPAYALCATAIGVVLGALYRFSEGWLAPALTHFLYDWLALFWLTRRKN